MQRFDGDFNVMLGEKLYRNQRSFEAQKLGEAQDCASFLDEYGRRVFAFSEGYPIFDSFDAAHENRSFHWYYVDCGVFVAALYWNDDGKMKVFDRLIREDFRLCYELRRDHLESLQARGLFLSEGED